MAHRISGFAAFPPVETTITPYTGTSLRTSARSLRRRQAKSKLFPALITYPPPPGSPEVVTRERPRLVAVRSARANQRREPMSVLRPHVGIVYAQPVVFAPLSVHLARVPRQPRRPFSRYTFPIVVYRLQAFGWVAVSLARRPRPQLSSSFLRPPVV